CYCERNEKSNFLPFARNDLICNRLVTQTAELLVVDQLVDRRVVAAHRTVRIAPQLQRIDLHGQRVEVQQPANQAIALAENQFHGLKRFDDADQSWQYT